MVSETRELCVTYMRKCKAAGKILSGFPEALTMLQTEAAADGLDDNELTLLVSIITKLNLNSPQRASLIKCLIPVRNMPDNIVEEIGIWFIATAKNVQVMAGVAAVQWLIGLMDYGLTEMKTVNTFYDAFFYVLVKNQKLEPYVTQLLYILTKPEDVTRRQVSRILTLQSQYAKPKKYLTALLSLFKSYKPEHVPENISSINIESAWKSIPQSLRQDLQDAAKRQGGYQQTSNLQQNFQWNSVSADGAKSAKKHQSLIPMVSYINIGSSMSRDNDSKSIFEVRTLEELGKHQLSLELPCNALSLLANTAGLHILTFGSTDYQSRFSYNLYNTLQNAFIHEIERYSYEERERLINRTVELCRYMNQEIVLVTRFLHTYLPFWNTRDHRKGIFGLLEWISFPSFADVHDNILVPLRTMWESSAVEVKCDILTTFGNLITNLFIKQGFAETRSLGPIFLGNSQTLDLPEILEPLTNFIKDLVVSGLYTESHNSMLLCGALSFYEEIARLEEHSDLLLWTVAPSAVIYGGFISKSIANVSRVCALLLKYRDINAKLREMRSRDLFESKIKTLDIYAKDLAKGLWYNQAFTGPKDGYFLRYIPDNVLAEIKNSCAIDTALNISNHCAVLPYKHTLIEMGLNIQTTEDCMSVAETYYPEVAKFLRIFRE